MYKILKRLTSDTNKEIFLCKNDQQAKILPFRVQNAYIQHINIRHCLCNALILNN